MRILIIIARVVMGVAIHLAMDKAGPASIFRSGTSRDSKAVRTSASVVRVLSTASAVVNKMMPVGNMAIDVCSFALAPEENLVVQYFKSSTVTLGPHGSARRQQP